MGIRGQLSVLVPGMVALGLSVVAAYAVQGERRDALHQFEVRNERVLDAVGVTVAMHVAQNDMGALDTLVAHFSESSVSLDLKELVVVDDSGRVLAHSIPERFNTVLDDAFTREAIATDSAVWEREGSVMRIAVPARSGIRWATVRATFSLDRVEASVRRTRQLWVAMTVGVFLLIAGALFLGINLLVVGPMRKLRHTARRMGEGHLSTRAEGLRHEFGELGETLNTMAQALQTERENLEGAVAERTRELQELNVRLERLAVTDGLTGLYNHRRFQEALQTELIRAERHKRPLSVLMIDVDFFKRVNDSLGHPAGDELLRKLGEVLGADLRQSDLISRYGGEEFAVLLPETTKAVAMQVGERMRAAVEERLNDGLPWLQKVTVSIGVATSPEDGLTSEAIIAASDQALYVAKRQGRNRVIGSRGVAA